jgi:transposase-like protein
MIEDMHDYGVYTDALDIDFDVDELEDSYVDEDEHANDNNTHHRKNMTDLQRQQIYETLLERSNCGRLQKNTTYIVAQKFQVSTSQVRSVWRRAKQCRAEGRPVDVKSRRKNCGRKRKQIDLSAVLSIPLRRRRTIRSLADALGVHSNTLHRWFKQGLLRRHSSTLKPLLRDENKKESLRWCVSMLDEQTLPNEPMFREMKNIIHMDEKWFNTTSKYTTYYMHPNEDDPHRTMRNKNAIDKVIFLSALGRPLYDEQGNCIWDGKVGLWPFVRKVRNAVVSHSYSKFCYLMLVILYLVFYYCRNKQKEEATIEGGGQK